MENLTIDKIHVSRFEQLKEKVKVDDMQNDIDNENDVDGEVPHHILAKIAHQEHMIKQLEKQLIQAGSQSFELHANLKKTTSRSVSDLRDELQSQMTLQQESSNNIQMEFNTKLEAMKDILNSDSLANSVKIKEMKETLESIKIEVHQNLGDFFIFLKIFTC